MEEQNFSLWGKLSNPEEEETSVQLERGQSSSKNWTELSEGESSLNIQEVNLEDNWSPSSSCHQGELTTAYSLSVHQSSLVNTDTLTQVPTSPSEVTVGPVQTQAPSVGFPQALNPYDSFPQTQCEETFRTDIFPAQEESACECSQLSHNILNAESSRPKSDEDHSLEMEARHRIDKGCSQDMKATWKTDEEMSSKMEGAGIIEPNPYPSTMDDDDEKIKELKAQREYVKTSADYQLDSEFSERNKTNLDGMQTMPDGILSLPSSKRMNNHSDTEETVGNWEQNPFVCTVFHLQEEEDTGGGMTNLVKEITQTKHAKNDRNCGESELEQEELSTTDEPEVAKVETPAWTDVETKEEEEEEEEEEEDLDWREMQTRIQIEQEKLVLGHDDQEEWERDIQLQEASSVEQERAAPPFTFSLNIPSHPENNLSLPSFKNNSSLVEDEEFIFHLEEMFSPSYLDSVCVQTAMAKPMPFARMSPEGLDPVSDSSCTQLLKCHDSGQWEYSSIYGQVGCMSQSGQDGEQPIEEGRKAYLEKEGSENARDGKYIGGSDGDGMVPSCRDLLVTPDPDSPNDYQSMDHPVDVEISIPASLMETKTVVGLVQEDADNEASDGIVGYVVPHEEPDSIQEPPNQNLPLACQLNIVPSEEASFSGSVVHTPCKNDIFSKDFYFGGEPQDSVSNILQSIPPREDLPSPDKESVELRLISSLTAQDPMLFQAQDDATNYFKKYQQHLKPPIRNFVFPGKEAEANTMCIVQQTSASLSPYFVAPEEDRTGHDCNTDSPTSPNASVSLATDVAQLIKPLTAVPDSVQTLAPECASSYVSQTSSAMPECRQQPAQCLTPPPSRDFLAQLPAPDLDPKHPSQLLEQLPLSTQTCQFLVLKPTATEVPQSSDSTTSDTELLDQPSASGTTSNQTSQLPDPAPNSDQTLEYGEHQVDPISILFKKSQHFLFPELNANQSVQLPPSSQISEATGPEINTNLLAQSPPFSLNTGLHYLPPTSHKLPVPDGDHFAQQQAETIESSLPVNYKIGNDHIHSSLSTTPPSALASQNLVQVMNTDSRMEELSCVPLAKSEGSGVLHGQKDLNTDETPSDFEVNQWDVHSDLIISRNNATFVNPCYSVPERLTKVTDMHDGQDSSDYISHSSMESQKIPDAAESSGSMHPTPLLAFTNPIHFFQHGPPSPPTIRCQHRQLVVSQEAQRQWQQTGNAKIGAADTSTSMLTQQMVAGRTRKNMETSVVEAIPPVDQRKEGVGKHSPLEKSSSCPNKSVIRLDTKEPESHSKKQEILLKLRTKSKDWHRQGVRKVSIPTDNVLAEAIAALVPSKEEVPAHKDKSVNLDQAIYGEKRPALTVENIKRRHSRLINSSRLLYQEYSDVALNKAIQSQKRADSLTEDQELASPGSPRLRRKVIPPQDSYLQRLSVSSTASLWQDIPMVRGSTMLLSMTREEQKLQEAKFELIASEASYLRSLNVAVDHFQHSQELQALLANQDKQWLFSRLQDVRDVSANFLFDLEEKLEENMFTFNVCDVALKHAPEFRRVYLPYVTNQTYQEQTFQRLQNGVPAFQQVLERLESDPVCQRLSLKSFLILPFQRITRLKLLLQNILKRTRPGADEEVQATQAYDALEKLIKDCNENVQRMKNTEELIHLSQNMEFECKIFPLISQSRRLIKRGELTALEYNLNLKWKLTTRPIYLHLFNDYLLLSRPRENGRFIVFDYAASSDVRGEKCEMKLHGANKNVFRLFLLQNNQGKKVEFLFRTETQSEKLRWISALTPQQAEPDLLDDCVLSDKPQVQCVKSYKARENDELALEKADIIMVLRQSTDGWIEGLRLSDGERGWLPSEQVEFISSKHARQMNLKEELRVKNAKQQVFHKK
ncbi:rho guanine nucleotide exchange factor 5 [Hemicordylus capensis]|uniref:rho guanine nucleotide exchange factor 5 n=1 Tax=Hemicordylus capensis TaxID=884348 RepID=UPI002302BF25|nr:rho guanine nucleotide exchange factor 5 [Hemicordylus capensis]